MRQLMQIPTQLKNEMEQVKLHSSQLVNVEISIYPFFLNMKTEISSVSHFKAKTQRRKPYHKTIAAVFLASLLEVRDNKRPNPDDVANNIHQPRQRKDHLSQLHVAKIVLTASNHNAQRLWAGPHDEFGHRKGIDQKGIERPKHSGSKLLEAAFEQPDIKSWIVQQSAHATAPQVLFVAFHKGVWPPINWNQRRPTANCAQNLPRDDQFAASIAIIAINHPHSHTVEIITPPRSHKHTSTGTTFLELKPELFVCLHPLDDSTQNPWKHSIQNDWLKQIN